MAYKQGDEIRVMHSVVIILHGYVKLTVPIGTEGVIKHVSNQAHSIVEFNLQNFTLTDKISNQNICKFKDYKEVY